MTRKCHNHIQQTNPWHKEEELMNDNSDMIFRTQQKSKVTRPLLPSEMIEKIETTQSNAKRNKNSFDGASSQIPTLSKKSNGI